MKQAFSELYSGKKTPENIGFIKQLAETFQKSGTNKRQQLARLRAKQYSKANEKIGLQENDIFMALDPDAALNEPAANNRPSKEDAIAELRRRGKIK